LLLLWLHCFWPIWRNDLNKMDNNVTLGYCCSPGELIKCQQ
jgi:hypothetical protein